MGQPLSTTLIERTLDIDIMSHEFQNMFGTNQLRFFYAPGRVNLIGEHTDYNQGFVLPIAIERGTLVTGISRPDRFFRVHSINVGETVTFDLDSEQPYPKGHWINYVEGIARSLEILGFRLAGADLMIQSNVPVGSGLSSSAALENATTLALLSLSGIKNIDRVQMALAGQAAEHQFVGTQCGIMDQFITALGVKNHALLIDCHSLETKSIPIHLPDMAVVICDSRVKHELASSAYNQRVQECRRGVEFLRQALPGIRSLRDIDMVSFQKHKHLISDEIVLKRVRHVVSENARTLKAAEALQSGDSKQLGRLMLDSHESLKNDYEVSCPELDMLVELAMQVDGVVGGRMTGGGFGGCTVNLVSKSTIDSFKQQVVQGYQAAFGLEPFIYITEACEGVHEVFDGRPENTDQIELNRQLNIYFEQVFERNDLDTLVNFANEQMPVLFPGSNLNTIQAELTPDPTSPNLPSQASLQSGPVQLAVSREFGIRLYFRGKQITTDRENIPMDYPWFLPDPGDPEDIAGYAVRHVARGSRGESPWPENVWPQIGGVRQGEQNWPHQEAAFGPYQLELLESENNKAILLSLPPNAQGVTQPNAYGVIPRGIFTMAEQDSIILALQHDNKSQHGFSWAPWFVLGFAMPREGTLKNPSTILAFPDSESSDPITERMVKVWNYAEIGGQKIALINPQAKTLNEPFKKMYKNTNWSLVAIKGSDTVYLIRSILRHKEQFFPFLEHGRYFIEVEHTGPQVPPFEKSTVIVKQDFLSVEKLSQGKLKVLSQENGKFEQDVRLILETLVHRACQGKLITPYRN